MLQAPELLVSPQVLPPALLQLPAVAASTLTPLSRYPVSPKGPPRCVTADDVVGVRCRDAETFWAVMRFGLLGLGKVPTAWSGKPLAVSDRVVPLQLQVEVLVALTEGVLLNAL